MTSIPTVTSTPTSIPAERFSPLKRFSSSRFQSETFSHRRVLLHPQVFSISISGDHRSAQISSTATDAPPLDSFQFPLPCRFSSSRFLLTPLPTGTPHFPRRPLLQRVLSILIQAGLALPAGDLSSNMCSLHSVQYYFRAFS